MGFGLVLPIVSLLPTSSFKALEVKNLFILKAVQIVRLAGLMYFLVWALDTYAIYGESAGLPDGYNIFKFRLFGKYSMFYWLPPMFYLLLTQALWIKKLYIKKAPRITFALSLLVLPSHHFIGLMAKLQGNNVDGFITVPLLREILLLILSAVTFFFLTVVVVLASGKLKDKR